MEITEKDIINFLKHRGKPVYFKMLQRKLGVPKSEKKVLRKILKKLQKKRIIRYEKGKYLLTEWKQKEEGLIEGRVEAHPSGYGFLIIGDEVEDLFIPPPEMRYLFDGDIVLARAVKRRKKDEAKIVKVLERAIKTAVGRYYKDKTGHYVLLSDTVIPHKIYINKKEAKKYRLEPETYVVVEITQYPAPKVRGRGRILKVLGKTKNTLTVAEIIARKYNLPTEHSKEAIEEAEKLPSTVRITKNRKDLTDQICFTIDPESARDHDDAVAIEKEGDKYRLYVHIADVSHYVKEGSAIDKEAFERGNTYYLPERALHMLPERLAAELCSLRPNEKKYAFTCEMLINKTGKVVDFDIYESVIVSKAKLSYDEALRLIVGDPALEEKYPYVVKPLRYMEELAKILMKAKEKRGSIDFDMPESQILFTETGDPYDVVPYERHLAHRIIEEFMIIANETVARFMFEKNYPFIYRTHEEPDLDKVIKFVDLVAGLGYEVSYPEKITPKFIQKILEKVAGTPEETLVRFMALRTMKQAKYTVENIGHFGLASDCYTHFTSPIRRYADINVHRMLKKAIKGKFTKNDLQRLPEKLDLIAKQCSKMERVADDAERDALDMLKLRILSNHIGEEFEGIITGVVSFGMFVELQRYLIEGLVPINTLPYHFKYDEINQRLISDKKIFRLGDRIKVRIERVDEDLKKLDLSYVE
ncbi:ribonuclease R [Persephonella hydrogeniphila]|uniref:Ribonuclease R n=1 Tax=Persephonella hydrogeniphila TaxID=198703 RepID=A0A285NB07_9AQUI|nr:ribonuclease R [Persephonella hydrogeniphila]SNZ06609.1 ribonuclease R [Persephonella hydrogeniphila]